MSSKKPTPEGPDLIQLIHSSDFGSAVAALKQVTAKSTLDKLAEIISPEATKNLALAGGIGVDIDDSGPQSEFILGADADLGSSGTKRISFGDGSHKSIDARDKSKGIAELLRIIHAKIGGTFQKELVV